MNLMLLFIFGRIDHFFRFPKEDTSGWADLSTGRIFLLLYAFVAEITPSVLLLRLLRSYKF